MDDEQRRAEVRAKAFAFDPTAYARAQARLKSAPLELTAEDFVQFGCVSPTLEAAARDKLREAQLAYLHSHEAPPLVTKSAEPAAPRALKDFVNKDGTRTVTYKRLDQCVTEVYGVLKAQLGTARERVNALERRVQEQDARILELEASMASMAKVEEV